MSVKLTQEALDKAHEMLPNEYMVGAMVRYFEEHIQPGHFLTAVLSNDLFEAFGRADDVNARYMKAYVQWLYNYAPGRHSGCWGTPDAVDNWLKERAA